MLSAGAIGGICVGVFVAIATSVIPAIIIYMNKRRDKDLPLDGGYEFLKGGIERTEATPDKSLPLDGGYEFLKGCIEGIEATPEISNVYRESVNTRMIHPHIKGYFQDPKVRERFFQDEELTKIHFSCFIKHYITYVEVPLIPKDLVHKVKSGEFDNLNISSLRNEFAVKNSDSPQEKYRKRILCLLFQHFHWFRETKIAADGSDREENSSSRILATIDLAALLAMNFDRTDSQMSKEEFELVLKLKPFINYLIIHSNEIFGSRENVNGSAAVENSLNLTSKPLLETAV